MKIHLTSDEINLLVYRYLMENGFSHTAFSFNSEANIPKNPFFTTQMDKVPPNALVGFLQKALLYIYLEYHTCDDTGEEIRCEEPFSIFKRHECWCRPLEQVTSSPEVTTGNNTALNSNFIRESHSSSALNNVDDTVEDESTCEVLDGKKGGKAIEEEGAKEECIFNLSGESRSKEINKKSEFVNENELNGVISQPPNKKTKKNKGQVQVQMGCLDINIVANENNTSFEGNVEESSFSCSNIVGGDIDNKDQVYNSCVGASSSNVTSMYSQLGSKIVHEKAAININIDVNSDSQVIEGGNVGVRANHDYREENSNSESIFNEKNSSSLFHTEKELVAKDVKMEVDENRGDDAAVSKKVKTNEDDLNLNENNNNGDDHANINSLNDKGTVKSELNGDNPVENKLSNISHIKLIGQGRKNNGIREVQFSKKPENPNKLVITWEEGCPELWDINTDNSKNCDSTLLPVYKGGNSLAGTAVSMNENYIVIGYENGRVTIFTYSGNEVLSIKGCRDDRESPVVSLKLSNNNNYLAIGDADGHVKILRIKVGNEHNMNRNIKDLELYHYHDHRSAIFGLSWCYNDLYLISGCLEGEIIIYDTINNKIKSFYQEGQILSIKSNFVDEPYFTCIMDGVPYIPIFKVSKTVSSEESLDSTSNINENLKDDGNERLISLDCIYKIKLDEDRENSEDSSINYSHTPLQINFIETLNLNEKLFYIVATSYNVYLFDELCTLVSLKSLINCNDNGDKEIVSIYVDNFHKHIYVGFNDGSINILQISSSNELEIKSVFTSSSCSFLRKIKENDQESCFDNTSCNKNNIGKNIDKLSSNTTTGIGTISINSNGNLVFVGGNIPAVYVFNN
ncbi:hypothetical protein RS030_172576 [Cryptosporidium xiaoi]|uniref:Anaphase-promoting complex subunit 4-like WD40 domain-containing protein n=1 Tax=Cryptosporidium xiaoi TaxID=659607 RepID=A0AAV9Y046_9CRYT